MRKEPEVMRKMRGRGRGRGIGRGSEAKRGRGRGSTAGEQQECSQQLEIEEGAVDALQHPRQQEQQQQQNHYYQQRRQQHQQQNYTQAAQGIASLHVALQQPPGSAASGPPLSSSRPIFLSSALSHYYYQQQQQRGDDRQQQHYLSQQQYQEQQVQPPSPPPPPFQQQQQYKQQQHQQSRPQPPQQQPLLTPASEEEEGEKTAFLPRRSSSVPSSASYPTPEFDEGLLQDVFAEEDGERGVAGEEREEDEQDAQAFLEGDVNPPQPGAHMRDDYFSSTRMQHQQDQSTYQHGQPEQQHLYQHQQPYDQSPSLPPPQQQHQQQDQQYDYDPRRQCAPSYQLLQPSPKIFPACTGSALDPEGGVEEGSRKLGLPRLPDLSPYLPGRTPAFDDNRLQKVFAEKVEGAVCEMGLDIPAVRRREGEAEDEDELLEGIEQYNNGDQGDAVAEGGEIFEGSEKEVLDLFEDGDIENW